MCITFIWEPQSCCHTTTRKALRTILVFSCVKCVSHSSADFVVLGSFYQALQTAMISQEECSSVPTKHTQRGTQYEEEPGIWNTKKLHLKFDPSADGFQIAILEIEF